MENIQKMKDNYFCSKCKLKEANFFCIDCEAYYDEECYMLKHRPKGKNEHLNHGQPQKLKSNQKEGYCCEHKSREAEYFCVHCKKPICSRCKMLAENIHSQHQVRDLYQAYDEELPNIYMANEIRKRCILQLNKIKRTIKLLIEKQILIEKEIDHEFREENDHIQSLTKEAKIKHFSIIAELNEMKKHLVNMDTYFLNREKSMTEIKLKPEAMWIKENYEEIITDMFKNFDSINLNYKVNSNSFKKVKKNRIKNN